MYTEKIPEWTQELMGLLGPILPENTYLAGGTGLTLYLNHRYSYDLDLYTPNKFATDRLISTFEKEVDDFNLISQSWQTVIGSSKDTEISVFLYEYPLIEETNTFNGLTIAGLLDIAAMKIEAIASRDLKRDFFDLYTVCQLQDYDLQKILTAVQNKYQRQHSDLPHLLKSLTYFDDAEKLPERAVISDGDWEKTKAFFIDKTPKLFDSLL